MTQFVFTRPPAIALVFLLLLHCTASSCSNALLTRDQVEDFKRDGYLYLPQFFSENDATFARLVAAGAREVQQKSKTSYKTFSVMETGLIFQAAAAAGCGEVTMTGEINNQLCEDDEQPINAFRDVALRSDLVTVSAELMQLDPTTHNMRVLRDVFLAKPIHADTICDWHVDDQGFWPQSFLSLQGINVWIAMDDMPAEYGGSMALARGSHVADDWRFDGYRAIGQGDRSRDTNFTRQDVLAIFSGRSSLNNTCSMADQDPALRERIEATRVLFDIKKGDVIFADRLLFHRTLMMTDGGIAHFEKLGKSVLNRYSIRYVPGSSRLPIGFSLETSLLVDPGNEGRPLDEVESTWYPRVWPSLEENVDEKLDNMGRTLVSQGKAMQSAVFQEVFAKKQTIASDD